MKKYWEFTERPVTARENAPEEVPPSTRLVSPEVTPDEVLVKKPRSVIADPPSELMFPFNVAPTPERLLAVREVTVGTTSTAGATSDQEFAILSSSISIKGVVVLPSCLSKTRAIVPMSVPAFVALKEDPGSGVPSTGLIHILTTSLFAPATMEQEATIKTVVLTGNTVEDQTVFAVAVRGLIPMLYPTPLALSQIEVPKEPELFTRLVKYPPVVFKEPREVTFNKKEK